MEHFVGPVAVFHLCGIWVAGPLPRPGKSITMMTHSRYGMMHPFALDGRTNTRGCRSASYIAAYDVQCLDDVVDEAQLHELANWMRAHGGVPIRRCAGGAYA